MAAIHAVLWNATDGYWRDYSLEDERHVDGMLIFVIVAFFADSRKGIFLSSVTPLWADSFDEAQLGDGALDRLLGFMSSLLGEFGECGLPVSRANTGQQWDYPNAWAPIEYFAVRAIERLPGGNALAATLAQTWLACNYCGWIATGGTDDGVIYEKYDVELRGVPGSGGEYGVQEGFGWTNGVALRFAVDYAAKDPLMACGER